jgi:hypothetical protein
MRTTIALVMALAASSLAFAEESQRWNQDDGANELVIHTPWCRGALRDALAATTAAKARLERNQDVMKQNVADASVADGSHSEIITRLRNQYDDYAVRERSFTDRYGADHPATIQLRAPM